jgi:hypothetical protein
MTNMLAVKARQFSYPITLFILMKTNDGLLHWWPLSYLSSEPIDVASS